ncbi:hypothetical protein [Prevotella dentasini]
MKPTEQTQQQTERFLKKVAQKFPADEEAGLMTDIHIRVSQDSGDLMAFDDDDKEITRCVVDQWIDNKDDKFYRDVANFLRLELMRMKEMVDNFGIMKPYSFVLENDDKENIAELYVADGDTIIIGGDLMQGLDEELNSFLKVLLDEE